MFSHIFISEFMCVCVYMYLLLHITTLRAKRNLLWRAYFLLHTQTARTPLIYQFYDHIIRRTLKSRAEPQSL